MTETQFAELARLGVVIEKLRACGDVEQAIAFLKKANNLATQLLGPSHEAVLAGRSSLAFLYFERAEYEEALEALNENLIVARNRWGDESDIVGQTLANMRMVQSKRLDEAADQLDKLIDVDYVRAVGNGLRDRYEETRELKDLHLAIQAAERALRLAAPDAEDHAADLNTLAARLLDRYEHASHFDDLQRALPLLREALQLGNGEISSRIVFLSNLATALHYSFLVTGDRGELYEAIETSRQVAANDKRGHSLQLRLIFELVRRDKQDVSREDLEYAFKLVQRDASLSAARPKILCDICMSWLKISYGAQEGRCNDLDQAIVVAAAAQSEASKVGNGVVPPSLLLALALFEKHELAGGDETLERALAQCRQNTDAVTSEGPWTVWLPFVWSRLGAFLSEAGDQRNDIGLLDIAIIFFERACEAGDNESSPPNDLSIALRKRYERTRRSDDLNRSVKLAEEALAIGAEQPEARNALANSLSSAFWYRYTRYYDRADLERGLAVSERSVRDWRSGMDPAPLNGLAIWRCTRFVALGDSTDLNDAIGLWRQAIPLTSLRSRRRERYSGNLAIALKERFRRTRDFADIDHAIALVEATVGRDTTSSSQHLEFWDLLGILLQERFRALHDTADIEKAIQAHRNACALARSTSRAAEYDANLANALRLTLNLGSLNEAIEIQNRLIADKSRDDLDFRTRINLGSCLRARYNLTGDKRDYDAVLATLEHSFDPAMDAHVEAALIGAREWGDWEFRNESWARALQAYGHVRDALHRIMQTQTLRRGSELWLRETQGVFARAAYAASKLGDFASALAFLEFGSARLLTMQLQLSRVAAETLKEEGHADLGDALLECMEEIASCRRLAADSSWLETIAGAPHANYPIEQLRKAQQTLSEVREKIQQIEGFSDILEPPALDEIRAGLGDAAVVYVTATDAGGQALLIRSSGALPEVIWLPDLTGRALEEMTTIYWKAHESWLNGVEGGLERWKTELDRATQLLWRWIMGHLVEAFEPGSTVYIVPIGGLALLPLHAAWTPDPETPTARLYAMDKICITYLPNASALVGARSREDGPPRNILVVEDPQPVEAESLVYSAIEVETALSGFAAHHVLRHGTATRNAILNSLPSFAVVHFACHANANIIEPLKSGLLVAFSEKITVQNLLEIRLENVRLAVLSACETAIPGRELPDEMIGLPTALLYAGASNIIASLWAVADLSTAILMARFYWVWRHNGAEPNIAMGAAQRWLRDATASEISQFVGESSSVLQAWNDNSAASMRTVLASFPEKQPFAHPHFWAAFTYVGA